MKNLIPYIAVHPINHVIAFFEYNYLVALHGFHFTISFIIIEAFTNVLHNLSYFQSTATASSHFQIIEIPPVNVPSSAPTDATGQTDIDHIVEEDSSASQ